MRMSSNRLCPCDSKKNYAECCAPLHHGTPAPSAEALMRSRYSAFVFDNHEYIASSWHSSTRPESIADDNSAAKTQWMGLRIHRCETIDPSHALVEFTARYKINGRAHALHEISRFVHERGHWFYLDGDIR